MHLTFMATKQRTLAVERRKLPPRLTQPGTHIKALPAPGTLPLRAWRNAAAWLIRLRRYHRVRGPVRLIIACEPQSARGRVDQIARCVIDLLSDLALIDGDGADIVQELVLRTNTPAGLDIFVEPVRQ